MVKRLARVLGLCLVLGALTAFYLWSYYHTPASHETDEQIVTLAPGTSLSQIATQLAHQGLLRHPWMFVLYVRWLAPGPHLQAGEYSLSTSMSPAQIADILRHGKVRYHTLTIPEGSTIRDIVTLVSALGLGNAQTLYDLAHETAFITSLGLEAPSLEGYLFPETYRVQRGMQERALLTLMVQTLQANYTPDMAAQADRLGFSQHEVLTLASLIEKEAQIDDERPLIAAVYHNRLRRGMRLQCDPTVIYALGEQYDGNIRKPDLSLDSPYNTYRYAGLPPGPIASSGRRAIEAALAPATVDYLYFVAVGQDGRHKFSTTLAEHNRAVREYQLKRFTP